MKYYLLLSLFIVAFTASYCQTSQQITDIIQDYQERINQNGGSIKTTDVSAITTFVSSATTHQYWNKLIDIGVLAGNTVSASLVKLKFPANGIALIQNNGYLVSDYASDKGFQLNALKSLNTKTNLNALDLKGLFGMSMWLEDAGSAAIGAPNSATPYSILFGNDTATMSYIGELSSYAAVGGKIVSSTDALYHVIKQSLNSTKVFVDGNQVGATSNILTTTQLRDEDIHVFRDSGNSGRGIFYCIDDGTLTDAEIKQFYKDVKQLLYDLGRKIAPPVISSGGLYSRTQNITISESPTASSMGGATIYYTIDGTIPTTGSAVYTAPIAISATSRIQAIAVKDNRSSNQAESWVAIVPEGFNTNKYYTAHVMVNLLAFTNNMDEWLLEMKASGYNLIWAHLDDYRDNYITTLQSLMDAAVRVGGIQIMPGASWWVEPNRVSQMFKDTWNHPGLFRIGDKRVYTGWDYQPDNQDIIDSLLKLQNITKDQYYLWVHSRYPYSYDEGKTWVGDYRLPNGYLKWNGNSFAGQARDLEYLFKTRPQLDGLINFAVDQGNKSNIIKTNKLITQSSLERGKFSMGGVSSLYASVSFTDFGFKGAAEIWDSILTSPLEARPTAMSDITANDYAELSYISPLVIPPTNGLSFIPPFTSGFNLGNNIRYPVADHSGIQKFLRPWADAFIHNQVSPTFSEDRMFAWYWLHPRDQKPDTVEPAIFNGYSHLNQAWWNGTVYATGNIDVGGTNQVEGMKYFFQDGMNKIRIAAHLIAPAQLKINDSLSDVKPAGAAYFEIEMGAFRGTPTFSIVRNGVEIKKGDGLQPITNNAFPGGWNFLSTEITSSKAVQSYYRSKTSGNWNQLNSWQSSKDSISWNNATIIPSSATNRTTIQNGHKIIITDSVNIDQLSIQNGGILNVAPNALLIVNNGLGDDINIATSGSMVIQSDSTGTGRVGNSSGTISGNVTVERYINSTINKSYRLLSPSVTTANSSKPFIKDNWQEGQNNTNIKTNINLIPHFGIQITGSTTGANGFDITSKGTRSLFTYNPSTVDPSWIEASNTNASTLDAKKGYLVLINGDRSTDLRTSNGASSTTIRATGTVATGTQIFNKPTGDRGTMLIGNPYPCPINWSTIYNDASTSNSKNFENYYTYWDTRVGTTGGYVTVNMNGVKSAPTNATTEIQSGQAFLIKVKKGVTVPILTIKESHKSNTNNIRVFRMMPIQQFMSTLYFLTPEGIRVMADAANTVFDSNFSNAVDNDDAEEMANKDENIAICRSGKMLSIEERSSIVVRDTIPLSTQRLKIQNYEWQFDPTNFTQPNLQAYLVDKFLSTRSLISLTTTTIIPFSVTNDSGSTSKNRFEILFEPVYILPLKINSIKAYKMPTGIRIDWTTRNDISIDRYEVQKSANGKQFTPVTALQAEHSTFPKNYFYFDSNPVNGNNYYRIKSINQSGTQEYSEIVNVKGNYVKEYFEIYPNPVISNEITIEFNNVPTGIYKAKLIGSAGETIYIKILNHQGGSSSQKMVIDAHLPAGNYTLQILGNNIYFTKRFLKG